MQLPLVPPVHAAVARVPPEAPHDASGAGGSAVSLSHNNPHCTGHWTLMALSLCQYWRCDRCGSIGYDVRDHREAAILENLVGLQLKHLSEDGRQLLEKEQ